MNPVNQSDLEWTTREETETQFRRKQLGEAAGGERLGCSLYELPPGGRSWPYHYHAGNEEAIYVLSGTGRLRLDDETHSLRVGDYVALRADESGGHRVTNDGDEPLRYLMVATMDHPDVTVYPDAGVVGVFVGSAPGHEEGRTLEGFYRMDDDVDYWEDIDGVEIGRTSITTDRDDSDDTDDSDDSDGQSNR